MPLTLMGIEVEYSQTGKSPDAFFGVEVEYSQTGKSPGAFFGVEVETTLGSGSGLIVGSPIVGSPIVHPVGRTLV